MIRKVHHIAIAVTDIEEAAKFYEDICVNRGWLVKVFQTKQEALDWFVQNESISEAQK